MRRIFDDEKKARRFARRVGGIIRYTQAMDSYGNITSVYLVEWKE